MKANNIKNYLLAASMLCAINLYAQQGEHKRKWGVETELIAPFLPEVGIITIKATRTITGQSVGNHGDLLLGIYARPNVKHDIVETINEYLFTLGYRYYFLKGLHAELQSDIGYAWGKKNKIDGRDYNNLAWLGEANIGYKFDFRKRTASNLYILPQFGVLSGLSTDIGPRGGKSDTFIQGKLLIGINF